MQILNAYMTVNGVKSEIPESVQKRDMKTLRQMHEKAKQSNPTWAYFGGILRIKERTYQVA